MLQALLIVPLVGCLLFLWIETILWFLNLRGRGDVLGFIIFLVVCDLLGALLVIAFRNLKTKHRERGIRCEAELWLMERRTGTRRRCSWQRRVLLTVPSIAALLFFLFEPETIGVCQHLSRGSTIRVGQYRIVIPITWIRYSVSDREQLDEQWIMDAKGIGRMGRHPYLAIGPLVLTDFGFSATAPLESHPLHARRFPEYLSSRNATIAGGQITCQELQYLGTHYHSVTIACVNSAHELYVQFWADAMRANAFYEFLQHKVWRDAP